jgi:hypothetical protein
MVTMIDEIFDRNYRAGRAQFNALLAGGIERFASTVMDAFNVLNRIEYQAPWMVRPRRARCN